jgi:hypothetical protein
VLNQAITLVRVLILVVLLMAAGATVTFVYIYTSNSKKDTFSSEYNAIASPLVTSLFVDLRLSLWMAHSLASTVTLAIETTGMPVTNLTIPGPRWEALTQAVRFVGDATVAAWIPFLHTDDERRTFEAHVRHSTFNETVHPDCIFCGGVPNLVFENLNDEVDITGVGVYTCNEVYHGGRAGVVPENSCPVLRQFVDRVCRCIEPPNAVAADAALTAEASYVSADEILPWTIEKGIFQFLDDEAQTVAVSREFESAPYAPMYTMSGPERFSPMLYDQFSDPVRAKTLGRLIFNRVPIISEMRLRSSAYDRYTAW